MTRSAKTAFTALAGAAFILIVAVGLFETALFHINPIKFGFHRFDFGRYSVFSRTSTIAPEFGFLEETMSQNEGAVGLKYMGKVQIILCERQSDINRYQPLASAADRRNAAAFAPWPNTIYLTPKATIRSIAFQETVGHELAHILLIQNYGAVRMTLLWRRAEWIPEGFATYLNNWPRYFDKTEILNSVREYGLHLSDSRFPTARQFSQLVLPVRFMIYRYFVEYLYQRNGSHAVVEFLNKACVRPLSVPAVFAKAFGSSIDDYWKDFWIDLVPKAID